MTRHQWSASAFTGSLALMLLMALLAVVAALTAGCGPVRPPQPPTPPTPAPRVVVATVRTPDGQIVRAGTGTLSDDFQHVVPCVWGGDRLTCTPAEVIQAGWQAYLRITDVPDMQAYEQRIQQLPSDAVTDLGELHLQAAHYDPSTVPLEQLARFRGQLFTAQAPMSTGPRPGDPSNIIATPFSPEWSEADWQTAVQALRARGYTHIVIGPMVSDGDCYHHMYPNCNTQLTEAARDHFLDVVQRWWDEGFAPIYRHKPDGWETGHDAELQRLDELMSVPRAQQLLRIVTYPGWEPNGGSGPDAVSQKYGWTNATYVRMLSRGARVFPNALRTLHTTCDTEVPVGGDTEDPALVTPEGFAQAWKNITPYFHVWEQQICGYLDARSPQPTPAFLNDLQWVLQNQPPRTRPGGQWYGQTAWGPGRGLTWVLAEWGSYAVTWWNWPEAYSRQIGDFAMQHGADGYLDGGSVPVGSGPVPWQR